MTPRIIGDPIGRRRDSDGSERAGEAVGGAAGRFLKKSVLELGGSDPFVVLDDADLSAAAEAAVKSRFGNGGQSLHRGEAVHRRGVGGRRVRGAAGLRVSPRSSSARWRAVTCATQLHAQVLASVSEGASLVAGGVLPDGPGWYYPPTVLDHVTPRMTAFDEETFGPVAAVVRARDDDHAVELANDTAYGLGAAVWSSSSRGLGRR